MSKLAEKAKKSKLGSKKSSQKMAHEERVIKQIKLSDFPRSYRFDPETMNILKATLARLNEFAPQKITETRLIKALITLSSEIDDDVLLKAIKEVW